MKNIWVLLIVALLPACKESPSQPNYQVDVSVTVAPSVAWEGNPATITARVTNNGAASYHRMEGCSYWAHGMQFRILDQQHREVYLRDPQIRPMCPDQMVMFPPGETLTGLVQFDGHLFDSSGHAFQAPAGAYTFILRMELIRDVRATETSVIERSASITWITP